jgi:2-phosphoglycerate kinase
MIYIIGGVARSGKSTVSRYISAKSGMPYFPMDILMSSIIDLGNPFSIDYKADSNLTAHKMWPLTRSIVENIRAYKTDYIFEGISFWPDLLHSLSFKDEIRACFIGIAAADANEKVKQLRKSQNEPNSWQNEFSDEELLGQVRNIIRISEILKNDCYRYGFEYFESGNDKGELCEEIGKWAAFI